MGRAIARFLWVLKLSLPKVAVGWMFALLTIDFNRVAIVEFGVAAVVVTTLLSLHYFLAPFQVVVGRLADTRPLFGFRRTPYLLGASLLASLLFLALPRITEAMGAGVPLATAAAVVLFLLFGLCMAVIADSYHSLVAEVTTTENRAGIIAVVWVVMILSTIVSAVVMNAVRPQFSVEAMQGLYNLTPPIVLLTTALGVLGLERRKSAGEIAAAAATARALVPPGNALLAGFRLLGANRQALGFFAFIACAVLALFLQENLIEVLGAEVFGADVTTTTRYQPTWGAGVLLGMVVMGLAGSTRRLPRKTLTLAGCGAAAGGFFLLGVVVFTASQHLLLPMLFAMGICAGMFNVGALAMMMDLTVDGATGTYMGLWGAAQALGMGGAAVGAGILHTSIIASGLLAPSVAYAGIFALEGCLLLVAALMLVRVNPQQFHRDALHAGAARDDGEAVILDVATAGA